MRHLSFIALQALLSLGVPKALAQEDATLGLLVEDCPERPIALDALRDRIEIELDPIEVRGEAASMTVRVEVPCDGAQVVVTVEDAARDVALRRRADLGDAEGTGRTWALALVIADLVRWVARRPPVPPAPAALPAPPAPVAVARPAEASAVPEAARRELISALGVGAIARLYTGTPTLLSGVELVFMHRWLRVSVSGQGTEVPADIGAIGMGVFVLEIAARPLTLREGPHSLGVRIAVAGGPLYAAGRTLADDVRAADATAVVLGGSVALDGQWRPDPQLGVEAALSVGFDYGADLERDGGVVASTLGLRVGLGVTALVPL